MTERIPILLHHMVCAIKKSRQFEVYWQAHSLYEQIFALMDKLKEIDIGAWEYLKKTMPKILPILMSVHFSCSWVPKPNELEYMVKTRLQITEVGAGDGTIARLLRDHGLVVRATDLFPMQDMMCATPEEVMKLYQNNGTDLVFGLAMIMKMTQHGWMLGNNVESRRRQAAFIQGAKQNRVLVKRRSALDTVKKLKITPKTCLAWFMPDPVRDPKDGTQDRYVKVIETFRKRGGQHVFVAGSRIMCKTSDGMDPTLCECASAAFWKYLDQTATVVFRNDQRVLRTGRDIVEWVAKVFVHYKLS